ASGEVERPQETLFRLSERALPHPADADRLVEPGLSRHVADPLAQRERAFPRLDRHAVLAPLEPEVGDVIEDDGLSGAIPGLLVETEGRRVGFVRRAVLALLEANPTDEVQR